MKVYTKVVIDMESLEVIEEESYDYEGPVALCGGGSGGGGGAGKVDYPTYVKEAHSQLMYGAGESGYTGIDIDVPMDDAVNSAISGNPFTDLAPYDPSTRITEMADAIDDLDSYITDMETTNQVENELVTFDVGMRDINAVNSSAFVIGRQLVASTIIAQKLQAKQELARLSIEARRIMIVADKEFTDADNEYQVKHVKWPLEVLQKGGNILATISGASVVGGGSTAPDEPSQTQSAVGGALSGAAAGAMYGSQENSAVGSGWGMLIGAALGAGSSYL